MAAWRDVASDTGRLGDGSKVLRDQALVSQDFGPTTIHEQNVLGGYNKTDVPAGGTPPRNPRTVGSRGLEEENLAPFNHGYLMGEMD
jgi:hypothetical protein